MRHEAADSRPKTQDPSRDAAGRVPTYVFLRWVFPFLLCWILANPASSIQYPESSYPPRTRGPTREWVDGTHDLIARAHRVQPCSESLALGDPRGAGFQPGLAPMGVQRQLAFQDAGQDMARPRVGDQRKFYAVDFARSGSPYSTDATCRAVGGFCYIFVEDAQWQRGSVTHTDVVKLKRAFDESTPGDPSRGIYELETANLGPPPDKIDGDPSIYILILDVPDGYNGVGTYVAGYFEPINQKRGVVRDPNTGMKFYSNEVEMVYIDSDPLDVSSEMSKEVLAHEFQHLIHWRHDPNEVLWINEGCSDYAALLLCGYGTDHSSHVEAFERSPQTSLVYWPYGVRSSLPNYGAAYLWMVYLHEHYGGTPTISSLIAHPASGINGINAVLSAHGFSQDFADVFSDWKIANFLDDTSFASGKYGYRNLDLRARRGGRHTSFPVSNVSRYIQSWAADYVEFSYPSIPFGNGAEAQHTVSLQIDFVGRGAIARTYGFDVRAIAMNDGVPVAVESVQNDGHISVPEFGYAVDTVVLVPNWQPGAEADFDEIISYSYSARLGEEVSFDVVVLPNAVYERYVDIVVQFVGNGGEELGAKSGELRAKSGELYTLSPKPYALSPMPYVPRITVTRLGKTLVSQENMTHIPVGEGIVLSRYVYQLYIPRGWDSSEIEWNISYLDRSLSGGSL